MRRIVVYLVLLTVMLFAGCDKKDDGNGDVINVTVNLLDGYWYRGQVNTSVDWSGASGSDVSIDLFKSGVYEALYASSSMNNGTVTRQAPLGDWTGDGFQLKITDSDAYYGWSSEFTILDNNSNVDVSFVVSPPPWQQNQTGVEVNWDNTGFADADSVFLYLYKEEAYISYLDMDFPLVANTGNYTLSTPVPMDWIGTNYRIRVAEKDAPFNSGWSPYFEIVPQPALIIVTYPVATTVFLRGEPAEVNWNGATAPVTVPLYLGTYPYDEEFITDTDNDGTEPIILDAAWEEYETFVLKLTDQDDNYGWSEEFTIGDLPTEEILAWYPLEADASDESGNDFDGIILNAPDFTVDDRFTVADGACAFPDTAWIDISAASVDLPAGTGFSFVGWFKSDFDADPYDISIFFSADSVDAVGAVTSIFQLGVESEHGGVHFWSEAENLDVRIEYGFTDNEWYYLAVSVNDDGQMHLWISNGSDDFIHKFRNHGVIDFAKVNRLSLGRGVSQDGDMKYYTGELDDVRFFNRTISELEARLLYHERDFDE
ncbi:MAG: LamG domain-containing protein [Candidatus Cloacimonetes bacterium]|nr:LamG domain-containing protein [Candidatus Cloacimonadota bacterium]